MFKRFHGHRVYRLMMEMNMNLTSRYTENKRVFPFTRIIVLLMLLTNNINAKVS